jgi:phage FluMu protein gp41
VSTEKKAAKYKYVQADRDDKGRLVAKGRLKRGLKIGTEVHHDFVLHEALTGDLLDAEREASTDLPLNFNMALLVRQIESVGTYSDAITLGMLRNLSPGDSATMREAQAELSIAGEVEQ